MFKPIITLTFRPSRVVELRTAIRLLLATAAAKSDDSLDAYRIKNPPEPQTIRRLAKITRNASDSHTARIPEFISVHVRGSVAEMIGDARTRLNDLSRDFGKTLYRYLDGKLTSYCRKLRDLMTARPETAVVVAPPPDRMRFEETALCAISFLFHSGYNVDRMFRVSVVLHSLTDRFDRDHLLEELRSFANRGRSENERAAVKTAQAIGDDDSLSELWEIKENIAAVSSTFCEPSVSQIVMNKFNYREMLYTPTEMTSDFVNYMYHNEMFVVNFESHGFNQHEITSSNTTYVLDTAEYGIANYVRKVNGDGSKTSFAQPSAYADDDENLTNLDALRSTLTSSSDTTSYYFNRVKYFNILLEVALFVSIKEGNKILRAARDLTSRRCSEHSSRNKITLPEARFIGQTLTVFRRKFDRMLGKIKRSVPLTAAKTSAIKVFADGANSVSDLLDFPPDDSPDYVREMCSNRRRVFDRLTYLPNLILGAKPDKDVLNEYYLRNPVSNVSEMLDFIETFF